jgi:hypothetical protein
MYGFDFNIGGNAIRSFQTMLGNLNSLQGNAKAVQTAFNAVKLPTQKINVGQSFSSGKVDIDSATGAIGGFQRGLGGVHSTLSDLKGQIAGAFAVGGIVGFGQSVVSTLSEFEKYNAVLTNTLGSSQLASKVMTDITDFAAKTPFQVNELTGSFVKLANQGFTPSMEQMTKLGDLASSTGKGFDQLSEAVLDAQMGSFERLKEFSIHASKDKGSDNVNVMFKNQTRTIAGTSKAMQDYLLSLGAVKGVSGSMAAISATIGGKISNLQDQFTAFKLAIGEAFAPLMSDVVGGMTSAFTTLSKWVKENKDSIKAWTGEILNLGKAVLIGYGVFNTLGFGVAAYNGIMLIASNATFLFGGIMGSVNAIIMANPIGFAIAAFAALTTGVIYAWNKFEGFRGFMYGMWEVLKVFGQYIYDYAVAPLKALGEILIGVFTLDTNMIQKGMNDALQIISNQANMMMNAGTQLGTAFNSGWNKGITDFRSTMPKAEAQNAAVGNISGGVTPKNLGIDKKGKEISGENRQVKNITITIGSLISGGFTVVNNNLKESEQAIRDVITRTLVDATNQVNYQ